MVGGVGAELLNFYLPSALERRRDRWFEVLEQRLADVEGRVLDDDAFATIVLEATKAALGTHLEDKLQLLAAAVRSSADVVDRGDDEFMARRLLRWVDELDPIHFEVLVQRRSTPNGSPPSAASSSGARSLATAWTPPAPSGAAGFHCWLAT